MSAQSQHPQPWWQPALNTAGSALHDLQQNIQRFAGQLQSPRSPPHASMTAVHQGPYRQQAAPFDRQQQQQQQHLPSGNRAAVKPVSKEDLGRATWTFLHTLAAQFPEHPTRQQQRDARVLIESMTRIYPCADCAQHFQAIVK
jgi:FAD-linked sulfhydryl oxidase